MGTSHFFEGAITITPALNFTEIKKAREIALEVIPQNSWSRKCATTENVFENHLPLKLTLDTFDKDTEDGVLTVTRATGLEPTWASDGSYPYLMCSLVEALIKGLPGHNWEGTVLSIDEYRQTAVKVTAVTGKDTSTVSEVGGKAYVMWDDDSTITPVSDISN